MPCWSGHVNVALYIVLFGVEDTGTRLRRWKGESMVNSSWRASPTGRDGGEKWVVVYSESSMLKV